MNINKPQIHSAGSAVCSIQGQPNIANILDKSSTFADTNPHLQGSMQATAGAYQADE